MLTEGGITADAVSNIKMVTVAGYEYNISGDKVANIQGYEYIIPEEGKVLWEARAIDTYLNARDIEGNVVKKIYQGEKFWVFGVFTKNTNRLFIFHKGDFCTVYIPNTEATGNTLWYEGESYVTNNHTKTNLRAHDYKLIKSVPEGQDMLVIGSAMHRPTRNVVIFENYLGTVQKLDMEVPSFAKKFVQSMDSWNLRERTGGRKVIQLTYPGEVFEVIGTDPYDSRYMYVIWNGIEGTIFNSGFEEIKDVPEFCGESYHAYNSYKGGLNLRASDYDTVIGTLPKNANFYVLGESVDNPKRAVVAWNGKIATIMKVNAQNEACITKIEDGVFVNIPKQTVSLYQDGKFIANSLCITGEETMARKNTPTGVFSITEMRENYYLKGTSWKGNKYNTLVQYWMRFKGGKGFHDATWCDTFGGDLYKNGGGSNGCVRLPLQFVKLVFENVEVGTPVIIFRYK